MQTTLRIKEQLVSADLQADGEESITQTQYDYILRLCQYIKVRGQIGKS